MEQATPSGSVLLRQLSDQIADVVEKAGQSVVRVQARQRVGATGIVWAPGLVVTADHVIERDEGIVIGTRDGQELAATLVGRDPESDLAVLRAPGLQAPAIARGAQPRPGALAVLVARPGRGEHASLSAVRAVSSGGRRGRRAEPAIIVDVLFRPGYSGAALVDADGAVLGVGTSGFSRGMGGGTIIGLETVERVVESLSKHGRMRRGYLGITSQTVAIPDSMRATLGSDQTRGLLIIDVAQGSPAERGGLLIGDVLVGLAEAQMRGTEDLRDQLGPERVDQTVTATVLRGGQRQTLSLTIGEQP